MKKLFIILALLGIISSIGFATNINACQNIAGSSDTYTLTAPLYGAPVSNACLWVSASNIVIDCQGFSITGSVTPTGIGYSAITLGGGSNITVQNCIISNYDRGITVSNSGNSKSFFIGNTIYNNYYGGIDVNSANNTFINNNIYGSIIGFADWGIRSMAADNKFINNTFHDNLNRGLLIQYTTGNQLTNNTAYNVFLGYGISNSQGTSMVNNSVYNAASGGQGIFFENSDMTSVTGGHLYNNPGGDVYVGPSTHSPFTISLSGIIFDRTSDSYSSYTTLAFNDVVDTDSSYIMKWSSQPAAPPGGHISFEGKYLSIVTQSDSPLIDSVTWSWQPSELTGYDESKFELWKYSGGSWSIVSNSPDAINHRFVISNLNPSSVYAIFQSTGGCAVPTDDYHITTSTTFCAGQYYINDSGNPGVIIVDADNINITCPWETHFYGNGSGIGFAISDHKNVTINTCYLNSYGTSFKLTDVNDSQFLNIQTFDSSTGYYLDSSNNNTFSGNNIHTEGTQYAYYLVSSSRNSFYDGAYGDTGLYLLNSPNNYILATRGFYTNNYGVQLVNSDNNQIENIVAATPVGVLINNSDNTSINHYATWGGTTQYGVGAIIITTNSGPKTVHGNDIFTILDFDDVVADNSAYLIKATNETANPPGYSAYENKTINISTISGTVLIDSVTFKYGGDLLGYNESSFGLWKFNSSGWTQVPAAWNPTAHTFTTTSLNPQSIYGIFYPGYPVTYLPAYWGCQILNESGVYVATNYQTFTDADNFRYTNDTYCLKIHGNNITVISGLGSFGWDTPNVEIIGSDNTVTGMQLTESGDPEALCQWSSHQSCADMCAGDPVCLAMHSAPPEGYPAIAIKGGSGNRITNNIFSTWYGGYGSGYNSVHPVPSPAVYVAGSTNNVIRDSIFANYGPGPSIYFKNSASGSVVLNNDIEVAPFVQDGTSSNSFGPNWFSPIINLTGSFDGYPYQILGSEADGPFVHDIDEDGFAGPMCENEPWKSSYFCEYKEYPDNCPTIPNPDQQDLDNNGKGTICDLNNEFELNLHNGTDIVNTKEFSWGTVAEPSGWFAGIDIFRPSQMPSYFPAGGFMDTWAYYGLVVMQQPFGDGDLSDVGKSGAGVSYKNAVAKAGAPDCGGGMVKGPISLAGMGYAFGFNESCTEYFKAHNVSQSVSYTFAVANASDWDVYRYYDNLTTNQSLCGNRLVTNQNVTIDPNFNLFNATQVTCNQHNVQGIVFYQKSTGKGIRFSVPVISTSGANTTLTSAQELAFTSACLNLFKNTSVINDSEGEGVASACNNATSIPRGVNITAALGSMNVTSMGEFLGVPGSGYYVITETIPAQFFNGGFLNFVWYPGISADTHLTIANSLTLADRDQIHAQYNSSTKPFVFNSTITAGSYIPCTMVNCLFNNSLIKFYLDQNAEINLTDVSTVDEGLGLGVYGGTTTIINSVFKSATGKYWMGIAVGPYSVLNISGSTINDSITGIVGVNSQLKVYNTSINTPLLDKISNSTVEYRDIRTKILWTCSNTSTWFLKNESGVLQNMSLPNGMSNFTTVFSGTMAFLAQKMAAVGCKINITNVTLDAGDLNGIFIAMDKSADPVVLKDINIPSAQEGILILGIQQNPGEDVLNVQMSNVRVHSKACLGLAGALTATVDGLTCNGYLASEEGGSVTAIGIDMSGRSFADRMLDVQHPMDELNNFYIRSVSLSNVVITDHGTNTNVAPYSNYAQKSIVIYNGNTTDPNRGTGTVAMNNVVATLNGVTEPVAVYGNTTVTTSGSTPPIVYPEGGGCGKIKVTVEHFVIPRHGRPYVEPVNNSLAYAFNYSKGSCAWDTSKKRFKDADDIIDTCPPAGSCITNSSGQCLITGLFEGSYMVIVNSTRWFGKHPFMSLDIVKVRDCKTANSVLNARVGFLEDPDGKVCPGRTSEFQGSELWVYEPDYVVWNGTQEYYPFVFQSPDTVDPWTIDVCVNAPEGYQPVNGTNCLQTIVANDSTTVLFQMIETGSVPDNVKTSLTLTHKGKKQKLADEVGTRMTDKLAKAKGAKIDKKGRITSRPPVKGRLEGDWSTAILLTVLGIILLGGLMYVRGRRERETEEEPEPEEKPAKTKIAKKQKRK